MKEGLELGCKGTDLMPWPIDLTHACFFVLSQKYKRNVYMCRSQVFQGEGIVL